MSNFGELQAEALHDDFDANKYRARVQRWLNVAQARIARRMKLPEREGTQAIATVAGTAFYALDTGIVRIRSLHFVGEPAELVQVDLRDIDDAPVSSARPTDYALNGAGITLYPTPDRVYNLELRHWSNAIKMVQDIDVPSVHEDYQDLMVTFARAYLFRAEDDGEMYAFYMSQFEDELARMRADVQDRGGRVKRTPNMSAIRPAAPQFVRPS